MRVIMYLKRLQLTGFRNYDLFEHEFGEKATVLVGANAVGKTNILEAIYMLATGKSFRAQKIEEMVKWGEEVGHVTGEIKGVDPSTAKHRTDALLAQDDTLDLKSLSSVSSTNVEESLRVTLTRGMVQGKKVQKRRYLVNGVPRRRLDFVGNLVAVKFIPQDLELISGSPSHRREFVDDVLSQVDREYRRSLLSYSKGLVRRNRLLSLIREGKTQRSALLFWNKLLAHDGEILTRKRERLMDFINTTQSLDLPLRVEYQRSVVTEARLEEYVKREIAAAHTLIGPHKDDFGVVSMNGDGKNFDSGRNLATYGSRGEQRMAVLWLKLAELAFMETSVGVRPLLLLDDIFSELDNSHDQIVMGLMTSQQTIVTTTEADVKLTKLAGVELKSLGM